MRRRKGGYLAALVPPILLAASLALTLVPADRFRPARSTLLTVAAPLELAVSGAFDGVASLPGRMRGSDKLVDQCRSLTARQAELESQVDYLKTQILDRDKLIAQLRDLKRVLPATGYGTLPAQVVAKTPSPALAPGTLTFTLGVGSDAGVRRDDLVVTGFAVVGRVISVTPGAAQVQGITSAEFRIAARTAPDGVEAVLRGGPGAACQINSVDARSAVKVGDYIVTSGYENKYPPGLLLGTVSKVQATRAGRLVDVIVKPAANFDVLNQVIVVRRLAEK